VFEGREPTWIARLGEYLLGLAILVRKPEMSSSQDDDYTSHMGMQAGFFMGSVVNVDHLYVLIFECELVVGWFDLGGVLREGNRRKTKAQEDGAERPQRPQSLRHDHLAQFAVLSYTLSCPRHLSITEASDRNQTD
jgi:hypothetical protein